MSPALRALDLARALDTFLVGNSVSAYLLHRLSEDDYLVIILTYPKRELKVSKLVLLKFGSC